jgi:phosphatidylglycerophosphate synthase
MNPILGWVLAAAALLAGWRSYGWHGLVLAATVITFWLLLQFNRVMRVMKNAAGAPVGHVGSAVMLHSRLRKRMTMLQVVQLTRSLGRKLADDPETWTWGDAGGATLTLVFAGGRLQDWTLTRREAAGETPA